MKTHQSVRADEVKSYELSNHKSYDDYLIPEPDPNNEIQFCDDEEDEVSDYTLMQFAHDHHYAE